MSTKPPPPPQVQQVNLQNSHVMQGQLAVREETLGEIQAGIDERVAKVKNDSFELRLRGFLCAGIVAALVLAALGIIIFSADATLRTKAFEALAAIGLLAAGFFAGKKS